MAQKRHAQHHAARQQKPARCDFIGGQALCGPAHQHGACAEKENSDAHQQQTAAGDDVAGRRVRLGAQTDEPLEGCCNQGCKDAEDHAEDDQQTHCIKNLFVARQLPASHDAVMPPSMPDAAGICVFLVRVSWCVFRGA